MLVNFDYLSSIENNNDWIVYFFYQIAYTWNLTHYHIKKSLGIDIQTEKIFGAIFDSEKRTFYDSVS